jgi:hypothetical protein
LFAGSIRTVLVPTGVLGTLFAGSTPTTFGTVRTVRTVLYDKYLQLTPPRSQYLTNFLINGPNTSMTNFQDRKFLSRILETERLGSNADPTASYSQLFHTHNLKFYRRAVCEEEARSAHARQNNNMRLCSPKLRSHNISLPQTESHHMFFSFKKLIFVLGLLSDCAAAVSSQDNLRALFDAQTTLLEKQDDKIQQQESRLTEQATRLAALETAFRRLDDDQEEEDDTSLDGAARYTPFRALQKKKKTKAEAKKNQKKKNTKDRNICYTQESDDEINVYVECEAWLEKEDEGMFGECDQNRRLLSGDETSVVLGDWKERRELGSCKKANASVEAEIIPFGRYNVGVLRIGNRYVVQRCSLPSTNE